MQSFFKPKNFLFNTRKFLGYFYLYIGAIDVRDVKNQNHSVIVN